MRAWLRKLIAGESPAMPAMELPAFQPSIPLPAADDAEIALSTRGSPSSAHAEPGSVVGRLLIIEYADAGGARSQRRIVPLDVFAADGFGYVEGRCLERDDFRCFRTDRIQSVSCGLTGEDLGEPVRFFAPARYAAERPRPDEGARAVQYGLRVLATLAKADGHLHPAEVDVMRTFTYRVLGEDQRKAAEALVEWGARQAPDLGGFRQSIENLIRYHGPVIEPLLESCGELIAADGEHSQIELAWMDQLIELFRLEGLKVIADPAIARGAS